MLWKDVFHHISSRFYINSPIFYFSQYTLTLVLKLNNLRQFEYFLRSNRRQINHKIIKIKYINQGT